MNISPEIADLLQRYFDKILVISLPRFTERHAAIEKNLKGLPYEFFWGEDKLHLDYEALKKTGAYDEQKAASLTRHGKLMNLGEVTCSLSHRKVYEAMIANGWQRILIFEDDVLPNLDVLSSLPQALKELPSTWELVYLGYLKHEKVTASLKAKQFFYQIFSALGSMKWSYTMMSHLLPKRYSGHLKRAGLHDCAHAYAITLAGAKKLVAEQTPVIHRADDLLSYLTVKGTLEAFITEPKYFDQEWFRNPDAVSVKTI